MLQAVPPSRSTVDPVTALAAQLTLEQQVELSDLISAPALGPDPVAIRDRTVAALSLVASIVETQVAARVEAEVQAHLATGVSPQTDGSDPVIDAVIDVAHLEHQRAWSEATFGPADQRGPLGPLNHIRTEIEEVAADPHDLEEWVDILILAFDGAWRAGHEPQAVVDAVKAKQTKNEGRVWPDWRGVPVDQPIEHDRSYDEAV